MAASEGFKEIVNQVAIQEAVVVSMALRDAEMEPQLTEAQWTNTWKASFQMRHSGVDMWKSGISKMEVTNIPETKVCKLTEGDKVPVIKNWLGQEGLPLIQTFMYEEKEKYETMKGLFTVICNKLKPQFNRIVMSLPCWKLHRKIINLPKNG